MDRLFRFAPIVGFSVFGLAFVLTLLGHPQIERLARPLVVQVVTGKICVHRCDDPLNHAKIRRGLVDSLFDHYKSKLGREFLIFSGTCAIAFGLLCLGPLLGTRLQESFQLFSISWTVSTLICTAYYFAETGLFTRVMLEGYIGFAIPLYMIAVTLSVRILLLIPNLFDGQFHNDPWRPNR